MARDYLCTFGSGNPSSRASLAPTFISFVNSSGQTALPPSITETYAGTGFYKFTYSATNTIFFVMDGATTGLATTERYIVGVLDPQDTMGQTLTSMAATLLANGVLVTNNGTTLVAVGALVNGIGSSLGANSTLIANQGLTLTAFGNTQTAQGSLFGDQASSFGSTGVDPTTVFGFLKRAQEFSEGNRAYTKATGILDYYSRGSSTLLREKTITDNLNGTTCI